jgi:hypothetical protein
MSDLCTLTDVQTYTGISDGPTATIILALIPNASALIETFCNRTFASATYTETRNGGCGQKLYLSQGPVTAVASLIVDGVTIPPASGSVGYGYAFDKNILYIRPGAGGYPSEFNKGIQNVAVTYTAGYAVTPPDINQACCELIADKLAKRQRIDKRSETLGTQQTIGFNLSDMPAQVKAVLKQYVRWSSL